jgi:hypothetical protein
VESRSRSGIDYGGRRGEYELIATELEAGRRVGLEVLAAYLRGVVGSYDEASEEARYEVRHRLGRLEHLLSRGGQFEEADGFYRARLDLVRLEYRARFRDYRDVTALVRSWFFRLWRYTSRYGTSVLRLVWVTFNVAFWFSVLYFVLDVVTIKFLGQRAFGSYALISYGSYFVIGFEGLFPGTAAFLSNTFAAQLAMAVENALGAILIISLVTLAARRVWRGLG